jgi:hypothetical protein
MELRSLAPNARAAVFAAVCTFLAVAAHRLMSAPGIPFAAEAFGAVAVFCFARIAAALGERGLASIGLLVGGSQIGLHLLFQAVQDAAGQAASTSASVAMSMPGMADTASGASLHGPMSGMPSGLSSGMTSGTASGMTSGMTSSTTAGLTSGMTIAHILAAAITAWWLRRGEAALFAVVERARVVVGASWRLVTWCLVGTRPIRSAPSAMPPVALDVRRPAVVRALQFTVIRRGPPTAVCQ